MRLLCCLLAVATSWSARADDWPHAVNTQREGEHPPAPLDLAASMKVPEGFAVSLFAGEPEVRQPVAMTFDDRGRLWVLECYTYTGRKEFDLTKRDRIVILEDVDGDGRADKRTVFWDQGQRAFGLEWGHGGVWVLQAPYLSFIPDRDRDDVPDGPAEHKLDGFTTEAAHNNANGLRWGPDGWLWGRHGITESSRAETVGIPEEDREEFRSCLWRYHILSNTFEVVCRGGINPWGFDWNEVGEMFFTNNVNGHLFHAIPGARYRERFIPPRDAGIHPFLNVCADHQHWEEGKVWHEARGGTGVTGDLGGGHSHCGAMVYLGDNWPPEYRGRLFTHNTHGKRVNQEILDRQGSGYVARHGEDFLHAGTEWFRGVELKYGPDGGVFLLDWSDAGECHDHDGVHRSSGRIYKVTHGKPDQVDAFDLAEFSDLQLVELLLFENDWWVRQAQRLLHERSLDFLLDREPVEVELTRMFHHPDVTRRLRAMWALYVTGLVDDEWLLVRLRDGDAHVRAWALRLLGDHGLGYGRVRLSFGRMAQREPSALVRMHLAAVMQKIAIGHRLEVLVPLARHEEDADDPNIPLMIWFAAEDSIVRSPDLAVELVRTTPHRLLRRMVARKLTAERARVGGAFDDLVAAIGKTDQVETQNDLMAGILDALGGVKRLNPPKSWEATRLAVAGTVDQEGGNLLGELAAIFSDRGALRGFREVVENRGAPVAERRRALEILVRAEAEDLMELLVGLLAEDGMAVAAMEGLAAQPAAGREVAAGILKRYPTLRDEDARAAISILCARSDFAVVLLEALESGDLPVAAITAFHARQLGSLGDADLRGRLEKLWGSWRASDAEKRREMERLRAIAMDPNTPDGDRLRGGRLFGQRCGACHMLWGEGGRAGPDLTGGGRKDLDYLLESVVDPSATVQRDYQLTVVTLQSGQVLSGFVEEEVGDTLRLRTPERVYAVGRAEIAEREQIKTSLMPEGLLRGLDEQELRDLFAYLRGEGPPRSE